MRNDADLESGQMRALTYEGEASVKVVDVPKPSIKDPTDALVRVTLSAVCGSDLHIYHGRIPGCEGSVLGHEFVGIVEDAGSEVRRFRPGDRVALRVTAVGHDDYAVARLNKPRRGTVHEHLA